MLVQRISYLRAASKNPKPDKCGAWRRNEQNWGQSRHRSLRIKAKTYYRHAIMIAWQESKLENQGATVLSGI
jgi:hypothetical protein